MTLVWRPGFQFDTDASTYIEAVEAADTQALETGVRYAINDFVIGCKQDGIWSAIKASCILAGARTLAGALTPLVGTAPTNFNFVSGDYNRKTGLVGNASTKYLNTNRNNNADPQNNNHNAIYASLIPNIADTRALLGAGFTDAGRNGIISSSANLSTANRGISRSASSATLSGFVGHSRFPSAPAEYVSRITGSNAVVSGSSETTYSGNIFVFARSGGVPSYSSARLAFYSIGESLDLAKLDTRVTALITAIGAAIP